MFFVSDFCEDISSKVDNLLSEISDCEWKGYAVYLDDQYPVIHKRLTRMKDEFWCSKKIGSQVRRTTRSSVMGHNSQIESVEGQRLEENTELYDPVKACWKELDTIIFKDTLCSHILKEPIDIIFKTHLFYACLSYQWGKMVMIENEYFAFEAFKKSSSLFDQCLGMVWFKEYEEKNKKLSSVRAQAGKRGGESKSEIYKVIQDKLVELIYDSVPEGGWRSKVAAVDDLINPLWKYINESQLIINNQSKKYRLSTTSPEALADTILKQWSTSVESVKLAFAATVSRNKRIT